MSKETLDVNKTGNFMNKQTKQMTLTLAKTFLKTLCIIFIIL